MPKYTLNVPFFPRFGGKWEMAPNRMGVEPLYGPAGFYNFYNNYTWTMTEFKGQLFIGTMDWSYLFAEAMPQLLEAFQIPLSTAGVELPKYHRGADLYRFPGSDSRAFSENLSGIGNYSSYGIRNMISDDVLYLGMANPMNLLTSLTDTLPEGGWELIQMSEKGSGSIQDNVLSNRFSLSQNYPNPFNGNTTIQYDLHRTARVNISVLNVLGQEIALLKNSVEKAGSHTAQWDGQDAHGVTVNSGIYFIRFQADENKMSMKVLFIQ
jgi:hypothetical protein